MESSTTMMTRTPALRVSSGALRVSSTSLMMASRMRASPVHQNTWSMPAGSTPPGNWLRSRSVSTSSTTGMPGCAAFTLRPKAPTSVSTSRAMVMTRSKRRCESSSMAPAPVETWVMRGAADRFSSLNSVKMRSVSRPSSSSV